MIITLTNIDHLFNEIHGNYHISLEPTDNYITDIHCHGTFYVDVTLTDTDISLDEVHRYTETLMNTIEHNDEVITLINTIRKKKVRNIT